MKKYLISKKALFIIIGLMAVFVIMPFTGIKGLDDTAFAMTNANCCDCHACTGTGPEHHIYWKVPNDDACTMCHCRGGHNHNDCVDCHTSASLCNSDHSNCNIAAHNNVSPDSTDCSACHATNVVTEHNKYFSKYGILCGLCHQPNINFKNEYNTNLNVINAVTKGSGINGQTVYCSDCHATTNHEAQHDHAKIDEQVCLQCHNGNVVTEHANRSLGCNVCHSSTDPNVINVINKGKGPSGQDVYCYDCHGVSDHATVHTKIAYAYPDPSNLITSGCTACHSPVALTEHSTYKVACAACHNYSPYKEIIANAVSTNAPAVTCEQCHDGVDHKATAHNTDYIKFPIVKGATCTDCHATDALTEHQKYNSSPFYCYGCHANNTPTINNPTLTYQQVISKALKTKPNTPISCTDCHGAVHLAATDAPHNVTNAISCFDCHIKGTVTKPTNDTVCIQCHGNSSGGGYSKNSAPKVATHSDVTTESTTKYGTWSVMCMDCHGVHLQEQRSTYGSNTYLGYGAITSVTDNGITTTFGYNNFVTSPNRSAWADYMKWGAKTGNERGLIIYPNTSDPSISFEIISATADTITAKGLLSAFSPSTVVTGNIFALTYGQNVVAALQYHTTTNPTGTVPVRFFDKTGPNSFAFDENLTSNDLTPDGICQVCHDMTNHFKGDGTLAGVGVHSGLNGSNCTMCHTHKDGFSAKGACNACHGYPPITNTPGGPDGLAVNEGGTGSASSGAHAKHATSAGANYPCETCHTKGMPATPVYDKLIQIGFNLPDGSTGGSYDGRTNLNVYGYTPGNPGTVITQGGTQTCSVTCHGSSKPSWTAKDTTQDCTFCHGGNATSGSPVATGEHTPHIRNTAVIGTNYDCAQCHSTTVSPGNDRLITGTAHSNGIKDVAMLKGGTWNSGTKTCTTTYCHSSGKGIYLTVHWGSTPLGCNGCHGTSTATGAPDYPNGGPGTLTANSHGKHVSASADCSICHANTTTNGIVIKPGSALHTNHLIDVTFDKTKAGENATWTAGTCKNISCHGSGAPQWGATSLTCQSCHLGTNDVDDFTNTFWNNGITGIIGSGEWSSRGHGTTAAGFTSTNACLYCHDDTITHKTASNPFRLRNINDATWGKNGNCQSCHAAGSTGVTIVDSTVPKNGTTKIGSTHYGAKHGSSNNGGQFCWDCHDPHGDGNRFMIHASVAKTSNAATGAPTNPVATTFTASATGTDYAKSTSPYSGICNVCHTTTMHYTSTSGDKHMSTTRCTQCHNHTGKTTTDAFGVDCLGCHSTAQGNRAAVVGQLSGNSHHIQGVPLTNAQCYQCHWEANSDGSVNSAYHGGTSTSPVNLVIYGTRTRPETYTVGTTAVEYTAGATPPPSTVPGVVKVVDTWKQLSTSGSGSSRTASFTAGAGTVGNRMVMIGMAWEDSHSSGCNPSSIAGNYGGQTITSINKANSSNNREGQWMGYVREAGIAMKSNNTITLIFSGCTPDLTPTISAATYEGVDQASAPSSAIASGTTGSAFSWGGLPVVKDGYAMYNVNADGISSFTPPANYIERYDAAASSNFRMSGGDKAISADGTESQTVKGNTSSSRWALVAVSVKPSAVSLPGGREIEKINQHCLGCHSVQNDATQPFGDGKTPKQYAWDGTSVAERYSQTGTTPWGKYSGANVTPKNTQTKAFSAHGNAANNQRGWNLTETWSNTGGTVTVACFDCHNSHGSTVDGTTTSYDGKNGTTNGGILKDTTTGKGSYAMTYKPQSGGSSANKNAYNAGAGLCFDCHMTQNAGTTPWGYQGTFGSTQAIMGYFDTKYFGTDTFGYQQRYTYKASSTMKGGHFGASSSLAKPVNGTIGGLCTPCHDPHGVSPTLSTNQQYSVPLLKGTWMTSPYKEDAAPLATNEKRGGGKEGEYVHSDASTPNYHIDQNTFNTTWSWSSTARVTQTEDQFAGLCLKCHTKDAINKNDDKSWRSMDRIHNTVKGWADGTYSGANKDSAIHSFTCSKCHAPHNSSLNRLMVTNCLDYKHRGRVASGGIAPTKHSRRGDEGQGAGQFPGGGGGRGDEKGGSYRGPFFFGTSTSPYIRACHDNTNPDSYPANQRWNTKTPW